MPLNKTLWNNMENVGSIAFLLVKITSNLDDLQFSEQRGFNSNVVCSELNYLYCWLVTILWCYAVVSVSARVTSGLRPRARTLSLPKCARILPAASFFPSQAATGRTGVDTTLKILSERSLPVPCRYMCSRTLIFPLNRPLIKLLYLLLLSSSLPRKAYLVTTEKTLFYTQQVLFPAWRLSRNKQIWWSAF